MPIVKLSNHIYLAGSDKLSHPLDCNIYLIDGRPTECVLIDSGCGQNTERILQNIEKAGFDLGQISAVFNTHYHYRHTGGNAELNNLLGYCEVIIHELDAPAIEKGDQKLTGAEFYGQKFEKCRVDCRIYTENDGTMKWGIGVGDVDFIPICTPGHTPGSASLYGEIDGMKVIFIGDALEPPRNYANLEVWKNSVELLQKLDVDVIYAGHRIIKQGREWQILTRKLLNIQR